MSNVFASSWVIDLLTNLAVSLILFVVGYGLGKRRERRQLAGRNLEQYDCYPFAVDPDGFPAFSPELFARAIDELLSRPDEIAIKSRLQRRLTPSAPRHYPRAPVEVLQPPRPRPVWRR